MSFPGKREVVKGCRLLGTLIRIFVRIAVALKPVLVRFWLRYFFCSKVVIVGERTELICLFVDARFYFRSVSFMVQSSIHLS